MTKKLELKFATSEGKNRTLAVNEPKENLTEAEIENAMNVIAGQDLFVDEGIILYQDVKSARYVTRTVEEVFDKTVE